MNLNQIFAMLTRMFLRRAVNFGVKKGMEMAARRGKAPVPDTDAARTQTRAARDLAKRARDAAKITNRLGR